MTVAEDFDYFEKQYGKPTKVVKAPEEVLQRLSKSLPESMVDYWRRFGFSVFLDGYFQLVNPETYAPALAEWLKDTDLEGKDKYHVISRSFLGDLRVWGEVTGRDFTIEPLQDAILLKKDNDAAGIAQGQQNKWAEDALFDIRPKKGNLRDRLFTRARERLGPLEPDQMYGFSPAVQIGGPIEAENLTIVSAPEHLALLAGLSARPVLTFDDLVKRAYGDAAVETVKEALKSK